jgi:hypothetical protein
VQKVLLFFPKSLIHLSISAPRNDGNAITATITTTAGYDATADWVSEGGRNH